MKTLEFDAVPNIDSILQATDGLHGRFVLEDLENGIAIFGAEPIITITSKNGITRTNEQGHIQEIYGCPFEPLRNLVRRFCTHKKLPFFAGGLVGYFSYDFGRMIESIPSIAAEDIPTPDYTLGVYDSGLVVDATRQKCLVFSRSGNSQTLNYWKELASSTKDSPKPEPAKPPRLNSLPNCLHSNFSKPDYIKTIQRVQSYIAAGDVYQVNLSQRLHTHLQITSTRLYTRLRAVNPAPHSYLIELGGVILAGASPETFLVYDPETRIVRTKPIKGTRPRGRCAEEDSKLAAELAASEKDRAENVMIVDMERNDLGRVATYGSVRVTKLWDIQPHPNVFQMVSTVEAELSPQCDIVDLLRATFPGGSVTGAPKIRAMQIIEELEPHRRGIYTGAAGYIGFDGKLRLSIVIRSFVIHNGIAYFHAGGGIVADSDPEMEYQETLDKISGLAFAVMGDF
ncbi:MAG: aminodeoxychorismate synthase component I [Armatimonadota bacterium]